MPCPAPVKTTPPRKRAQRELTAEDIKAAAKAGDAAFEYFRTHGTLPPEQ